MNKFYPPFIIIAYEKAEDVEMKICEFCILNSLFCIEKRTHIRRYEYVIFLFQAVL